jgi:hypothetical protein
MRISFKKILSLFIICLLFSCGKNKSPFYDEVLKSEQGQIRDIEIGTTIETVKALENEVFLRDKMDDYLHYDYEISMGNTYTATYDFSSENELYEIEIAVFLDVIEDAEMLFQNFSDHFNRKYSVGKTEDDGYITWNTHSKNSNNRVAISMINDSESYGYLTILIRDLDY